jgi:hypothetical protein
MGRDGMGRGQVGLSLKRNHLMKYKNAALAVLFSASLAVAVQDFGVPPGIPNVFSAGEVAVADDVNENFEWVENELDALDLVDQFQDDRIDDIEDASKHRTQSFTALGYVDSLGLGPSPKGDAVRGGVPSDGWGSLNIPIPQDWDPSTEMTVTVGLQNLVDGGQTGQDVEIDLYGDYIFQGDSIFDEDNGPFCSPGPICGFDFYANCFISVPTVGGGGGGPLLNGEAVGTLYPYLVTATFTITAPIGLIGGGVTMPPQMRINIFEPSNPLIGGPGGGDPTPRIVLRTYDDTDPLSAPCYVTLEYTAF